MYGAAQLELFLTGVAMCGTMTWQKYILLQYVFTWTTFSRNFQENDQIKGSS